MGNRVKRTFGLCVLFGSAFCVLTSPIYEDEQLYEGSPCTLANGEGNGTCVKLDNCPSKMEELHGGRWRGEQEDRCGFAGFVEIVCCGSENTTASRLINSAINPAEAACQEYGNEVSGSKKSVTYHILGGVDAESNEFPYMAALGYTAREDEQVAGNIKYSCGGTLISRQHILTAAHCVNNRDESVPVEVRLGSTNLGDADGDVQRVGVLSVTSHPGYKRSRDYNDIAIIKLQEPVRLTNSVQPACLLTKQLETLEASAGSQSTLLVLGWGAIEFGGDGSPTLKKAVGLRHVQLDECSISYGNKTGKFPKLPNGIDDTMICAIDANRTRQADTCGGDSGGPLLVSTPTAHPVVAGVTAFGQACGGSTPSVYTSVFSYMSWIESQVWPAITQDKKPAAAASTRTF